MAEMYCGAFACNVGLGRVPSRARQSWPGTVLTYVCICEKTNYMYISVYIYIYDSMSVCPSVRLSVCTYVCIYLYVYVMCVCKYMLDLHTCMYACIHKSIHMPGQEVRSYGLIRPS